MTGDDLCPRPTGRGPRPDRRPSAPPRPEFLDLFCPWWLLEWNRLETSWEGACDLLARTQDRVDAGDVPAEVAGDVLSNARRHVDESAAAMREHQELLAAAEGREVRKYLLSVRRLSAVGVNGF